jgi:hypothetical protein
MLLVWFVACIRPVEEKSKTLYYFDLKNYFEQEAVRLQSEKPIIKKTVFLNDHTEFKEKVIEDWNKELMTFMEADINKSALAGKYSSDTLFSQGRIQKIIYNARDDKLKTRSVIIAFDSMQQADKIAITIETVNTLYHSSQQLYYHKNHFYSVSGRQKIRWMGTDEFKVEVRF